MFKKTGVECRIHDTDMCLLVCIVSTPGTSNRTLFRESKLVYCSKKTASEGVEIINEYIESNLYSTHFMTLLLILVSWG